MRYAILALFGAVMEVVLVLVGTIAAWLSAAPVIGSLGLLVVVSCGLLALLQIPGIADWLGGWRRRVEPKLVDRVSAWLLGEPRAPG